MYCWMIVLQYTNERRIVILLLSWAMYHESNHILSHFVISTLVGSIYANTEVSVTGQYLLKQCRSSFTINTFI